MRILINGSNGFVGSFISSYFSKYDDVVALSREDLDFTDNKLVNDFFMQSKSFDAVINCAATGRYLANKIDNNIFSTNLNIYANLYNNRHAFKKLINIGTGAEFGLSNNINYVNETEIYKSYPIESYGFSKNIISRLINDTDNFYTVRIFGCFDLSEPPKRLISGFIEQIKNTGSFSVTNDRFADYVSLSDVALLIKKILLGEIHHRDLNMVYKEKYLISDILRKYCDLHGIDPSVINIKSSTTKNYTGSSALLDQYNLPFDGLEKSLKKYKYE